jgi:gliding motility-associated-like protein
VWELSDNTVLQDSIAYHSFDSIGTHIVTLSIETEYNCIDTISKRVQVDNYVLWMPSAFSPKSEIQENTVFKAEGVGVKEFVMKIYSRWGGLVFESNDIDYGWDGLDANNEIITGTYTYYIQVVNVFNEVHKYEGVFNLIR